MHILKKVKDGGKESPVDAYFLFELKGLCSIALLKFNKGTRENFHTHAFDALTWFLSGHLVEERATPHGSILYTYKRSLLPKFTAKSNLHRVRAHKTSWCFTIRGPWENHWTEYNEEKDTTYVLTHHRHIVDTRTGK